MGNIIIAKSQRIICWFSCGAASAYATKLTLSMFGKEQEVVPVYCDTSKNEHSDNQRFITDCEKWFGVSIKRISNPVFKTGTVEEVFQARKYMSGVKGAVCTGQLKKVPRFAFATPDDVHVFGFTSDESKRIRDFEERNFELNLFWPLQVLNKTKQDCYKSVADAGIELPTMYKLGYKNNNCLGCVKATSPGYWQKVFQDFPKVFAARAKQSRQIGCKLVRVDGKRIYLDELPANRIFKYKREDISCGVGCGI